MFEAIDKKHLLISGLLVSVFCFISGYFLGKKHVSDRFSSIVTEQSLDEKIQGALYVLSQDDEEKEEKGEEDKDETKNPEKALAQEQEPHGYAQLVGFASRSMAEHYKEKLLAKGFPVHIIDKETLTKSRGKTRKKVWYQVVTTTLPKSELEPMVELIAKQDKLKGCQYIYT